MPTLIVKPTERCTSHCAYCDVVTKKRQFDDMTEATLRLVFQRVNDYLETYPDGDITWIWHGGEPLLMGKPFYIKSRELLETVCKTTRDRITFAMQSNLMLMDEEWAGLLKELGIHSVGSSYDPLDGARGPGTICDTTTYNRAFLQGKMVAEQHGIGVGIIYVLTKPALERPLDIFYHLVNITGGGFNIHPVLLYHNRRPDLAVTPDEYVAFLGEIFPEWWAHRERYGKIEPFNSLVRNIIENHRSLGCVFSGSCMRNHISIAPDGHLSHCGRSEDWDLLDYGMLQDKTLDVVLNDPQREALENRNALLRNSECVDCRFWSLCHGGCPLDGWAVHGDLLRQSPWGCAEKKFITEYFEPITGALYAGRDYLD